MAPLMVVLSIENKLQNSNLISFLRFVIEQARSSFDRLVIVHESDLISRKSDNGKVVAFSRDYASISSTVDEYVANALIDSKTFDNWVQLVESANSFVYSDLGPNCFVHVFIVGEYKSGFDFLRLTETEIENSSELIQFEKIAICDSTFAAGCENGGDLANSLSYCNGWRVAPFPFAAVEQLVLNVFAPPVTSLLVFGKIQTRVNLMPNMSSEMNGSDIVIHGFIEAATCFGPAILSKHVVIADNVPNVETSGTLCTLLHASLMSLKQNDPPLNLVALVTLHSKNKMHPNIMKGVISTHADLSKRKSNLVLKIFPPDKHPPWLGPWKSLVPKGLVDESPCHLELQSHPVPDESKSSCSYNDLSCIAWLQSPNLFADAQKFVRLAKKVTPEKRGQVFTEADRIISIATSLSFPQYLQTISSLIGKEMEINPQNPNLTILNELQQKFMKSSHSILA